MAQRCSPSSWLVSFAIFLAVVHSVDSVEGLNYDDAANLAPSRQQQSSLQKAEARRLLQTETVTSISPQMASMSGGILLYASGTFNTLSTSYHPMLNVSSLASVINANLLACSVPAWTFAGVLGDTYFKVYRGTTEVAAAPTIFSFVQTPIWNAPTPSERTVFSMGVHCVVESLTFSASGGKVPLRLTLSYSLLRPNPSYSFVAKNDIAPSSAEVLRNTQRFPAQYFLQSAAVDTVAANGSLVLGPLDYSLVLPTSPQPLRQARDGETINIPDNEQQPSELTFETSTSCNGVDSVCGTISLNVSRGWEGNAYEICATARHANVPTSVVESSIFATRCIIIVVPKCRMCYSQYDTLHSIATSYGSTWLDLWSVNPQLSRTTPRASTDEVGYNTPGDLVYFSVPLGQSISTGVLYKLGTQDYVSEVAQRFGMRMTSLMALNPDIVSANQDAVMAGKMICILQQVQVYNRCERQTEQPNPLFWETITGYDETGAPLKVYNPRYPREPRA